MLNFQNKRLAAPVSLLVSLVLTTVVALVWGSAATSAAPARAAAAARPVAMAPGGDMTSRLVGETANGRDVTGKFVPLQFKKRNGKVFARGLVQGAVHRDNGSVAQTFAVMRTVKVKRINGDRVNTANRTAARGAACDILHLTLGPLDLDLLGLVIHLDRVVLTIDADPGPGNLLGNLLCAVANLLNGGLQGALGRLTRLLNRILGQLNLGV